MPDGIRLPPNHIRSPASSLPLLASQPVIWGAMWGGGLKYIPTCLFFCCLAWQTVRYERIQSKVNAATMKRRSNSKSKSKPPLPSLPTCVVAPITNSCVGSAALICCSGCALNGYSPGICWLCERALPLFAFHVLCTLSQLNKAPDGQWVHRYVSSVVLEDLGRYTLFLLGRLLRNCTCKGRERKADVGKASGRRGSYN